MSERLTAEIDRLYEVFGRVPRPLRMEGCSHCVEPDEDRPLLETPLRSLDEDTLRRYATDALYLWGDVDDLRYFLPRLLELAAEDEFNFPDPEIVFRKLSAGEFQTWADDERDAVHAFLARWWETRLEDDDPCPCIETVLCSLGLTRVDLAPFLEHWERLDSEGAIRNLHDFVIEDVTWRPSGPAGGGPKLRNGYWEFGPDGHQAVITWLTGGPA
ncbi:hypothetical protein ACFQ07_29195, partial [Actinomadura adrarensis]